MNVVIFGAGASYATHGLPMTAEALRLWRSTIEQAHPLLALALDWVVPKWRERGVNLEEAWQQIDIAWKERQLLGIAWRVNPLGEAQRRQVWELAEAEQRREEGEPWYYRSQVEGARRARWSTEQFLSVAAGWEFRRLIQENLATTADPERCAPYRNLLQRVGPTDSLLSFNYDTLAEQQLDHDKRPWTYDVPSGKKIAVLKPHGSVNWTHARDGDADQIRLSVQLKPGDMGYHGTRFIQNLVVGLREKTEHTWSEPSDAISKHLQGVLDACELAIRRAERLFIVGYSFPPADTTFLDVVAKACAKRPKHNLSLVVIDKANRQQADRQTERLRQLFGPALESIGYCVHGLKVWGAEHDCLDTSKRRRRKRRAGRSS